MSFAQISLAVLGDPRVRLNDLRIYGCLLAMQGEADSVRVTLQSISTRLAAESGSAPMDIRRVSDAIARLSDLGLISKKRGGWGRPNAYSVKKWRQVQAIPAAPAAEPDPEQPSQQRKMTLNVAEVFLDILSPGSVRLLLDRQRSEGEAVFLPGIPEHIRHFVQHKVPEAEFLPSRTG